LQLNFDIVLYRRTKDPANGQWSWIRESDSEATHWAMAWLQLRSWQASPFTISRISRALQSRHWGHHVFCHARATNNPMGRLAWWDSVHEEYSSSFGHQAISIQGNVR
jgi:hypothetical protein